MVDPDTGGEKLDDIRTSFGTFLARGETDVIRRVEQRVAEWAQVPEENAEQLQILRCAPRAGRRVLRASDAGCRARRYGIGQQYNDHWDWFDKKTLDVRARAAPRAATLRPELAARGAAGRPAGKHAARRDRAHVLVGG